MKVEIEVPDENVRAAIESAGIRYWAREVYRTPDALQMSLVEDMTHTAFRLVGLNWNAALAAMAMKAPGLFGRMFDPYQIDVAVGDALVQFACFSELKYS